MSAFVVIGAVLAAVAIRVAVVAQAHPTVQPRREVDERGLVPSFEIVDAGGRTVARFVERFDLELSPRSMWRAHTPERIAARISAALGGEPSAQELLGPLLRADGGGMIRADGLLLDARETIAVGAFLDAGLDGDPDDGPRIHGMWLEPLSSAEDPSGEGPPPCRIVWAPAVTLSASERSAHGHRTPAGWTRALLGGLADCLGPGGDDVEPAARAALEKRIWRALMPSGHGLLAGDVPPQRVPGLLRALEEERVAPIQMRLVRGRDRRYPLGAFEVLGSWGFVTGQEAEPRPREGLERSCERLLAREDWPLATPGEAVYSFLVHRSRNLGRSQYFLGYEESGSPPRVVTSLDLDLQRIVRRELDLVMEEHRPALAMAIVLRLASGEVLAVESRERYEVQPFAPVFHAFTPGSTFKMITMATALDEGLVRPEERFDVGHGEYRLPDSSRVIHEAEGSLTGVITAVQSFAYSVNAGLVQIGTRIPPATFRARILELGYGRAPGTALGVEHPGSVPKLPWDRAWTQASISFGHELTTTLWQHAAGLAAIARGGVWKPLTLVCSVEQDGVEVFLEPPETRRVFSAQTCATIRTMMALGASEGTGRRVAREGIEMGTKTGTAQKVASEICLHVESAEREACRRAGLRMTPERYRSLRGRPGPHATCYTSSMCIVGRFPGDGEELMVLVVVDEPCGKQKYGSRVAGPAAAEILARALRLQRRRERSEVGDDPGFFISTERERNPLDEPWREPLGVDRAGGGD